MDRDEIVMGIDQSFTSTGLVVFCGDCFRWCDIISTVQDKTDDLSNFRRASTISEDIIERCEQFDVDRVVIENLGFAATGNATRNLAGLQYVIVTQLLTKDIPVSLVAPNQLKKAATGNGRASKEEMIEAVGPDFYDDLMKVPKSKGRADLADAYALAKHF